MGFEPFLLYIRPCCFLLQCSLIPFFSANLSSMASLNPEPVSISSNGIDQDNALQKHVAFFDRNHDGIIYPWETYKGFRAIGSGVALSVISALFINGFLSHKSSPKKLPSLLFPIYVKNINKCKHGSDTGVYDSRGRFLPSKFEEIFAKHAVKNANALTGEELSMMLKANREPKDCSGWLGSWTEWKILYSLCKDKDGLLHKETLRAVYDGSLFERMEGEAASRRQSVQSRV